MSCNSTLDGMMNKFAIVVVGSGDGFGGDVR